MTKEQAIKICNTITEEELLFHAPEYGIITKYSPINRLLGFLDKHIKIGFDRETYNPSKVDCKRTAEFLREIADALHPLTETENGNQNL